MLIIEHCGRGKGNNDNNNDSNNNYNNNHNNNNYYQPGVGPVLLLRQFALLGDLGLP